ncbi:hypothetical protein GS501_05005 [Saccharibacter sp. 17.LH.SD]|uniref:hypothetical protein n=1 Tax=Saccharibacter sp. 17.LH.SD TaxID=2689393 RepID=UPI001371CE39|nr:hypothetical protein [Saccharibacter sp. 17.LH.SD]MXV44406.1 hypothetical protein [Saccharibacter sp. 17.LH.SD]
MSTFILIAAGNASAQDTHPQKAPPPSITTISAQNEHYLQQMGLTPTTANNAMWAIQHKPHSQCAFLAKTLIGDYTISHVAPDLIDPNDDGETVLRIEKSHMCDRANLQ